MNCTASGAIVFTSQTIVGLIVSRVKKPPTKQKGTESVCAVYVTSNSLIAFLVLILDILCAFYLVVLSKSSPFICTSQIAERPPNHRIHFFQ